MTAPRRWTLHEGSVGQVDFIMGDEPFEDGEAVMPVSEHDQAVSDAWAEGYEQAWQEAEEAP